jgi:hypothetical protein
MGGEDNADDDAQHQGTPAGFRVHGAGDQGIAHLLLLDRWE